MGTVVRSCPQLQGPRGQPCSTTQPVFISSRNVDNLLFSTCNTSVGTLVTIGCYGPQRKPSPSEYIFCQPNGEWNSSVPICSVPVTRTQPSPEQLTLETRIIIGVVCGFAALVLLIILTLSLVYYMKVKRVDKRNRSLDLPETDFYWTAPISHRSDSFRSDHGNLYQTEINPMYGTRLWRPSYLDRYSSGFYSTPNKTEPSRPPLPPPPYPERRPSVAMSNGSIEHWYPRDRDGRLPRYHMDETGFHMYPVLATQSPSTTTQAVSVVTTTGNPSTGLELSEVEIIIIACIGSVLGLVVVIALVCYCNKPQKSDEQTKREILEARGRSRTIQSVESGVVNHGMEQRPRTVSFQDDVRRSNVYVRHVPPREQRKDPNKTDNRDSDMTYQAHVSEHHDYERISTDTEVHIESTAL